MRRPISVTVIGSLFMLVGLIATAFWFRQFLGTAPPSDEKMIWLAVAINLLAGFAGVGLLRGRNWARWMVVAWMASHVVLSLWHSVFEVCAHAVMLALLWFFLFKSRAALFFSDRSSLASTPISPR